MPRLSCRSGLAAFRVTAPLVTAISCVLIAHAQTPSGRVLSRPAEGFTLSMPAGWSEQTVSGAAAAIAQASAPDVLVMVFVQREAAAVPVTDALATSAVRLKADKTRTILSTAFDVTQGRPSLTAVLEDETARYKLTVIPRDAGDTSQVYYGVMTAAPRAKFADAQVMLDRIAGGFSIVALTSTAAPASSPVAAPAASGLDRAKVIERILAPRPRRQG